MAGLLEGGQLQMHVRFYARGHVRSDVPCRCRLRLANGVPNGLVAKIGISDGEMVKVVPHKATGALQP